jgi:hypothetical protein
LDIAVYFLDREFWFVRAPSGKITLVKAKREEPLEENSKLERDCMIGNVLIGARNVMPPSTTNCLLVRVGATTRGPLKRDYKTRRFSIPALVK